MFSRRALLTGIAASAVAVTVPAMRAPAGSFVGELSWQVFTYRGLHVVRIDPLSEAMHALIHFEGDDGTTGSMSTADPEVIKQMEGYRRSGSSLTLELSHQQPSVSFVEDESWTDVAEADAAAFEDWDEEGCRNVA